MWTFRYFRFLFPLLIGITFIAATGEKPPGGVQRGALVLAFDDGFSNWLEVVAPELREVGGKATAFVNNQYVPSRLSFEDLHRLRDEFGWEIGTHGFHHVNARSHVRTHGIGNWEATQLVASVEDFRKEGVDTRVLAFPYNDFDPALARVANRHVVSWRRATPLALALSPPPEGGPHPATSIDTAAHVPVETFETWVDNAARIGGTLFLFGHRVLPDAFFANGEVAEIEGNLLVAREPLTLPKTADPLVLVPDISRRLRQQDEGLQVERWEGNRIWVVSTDLSRLTRPGATFRMGPPTATPLSDFRALLRRASEQSLRFLTVSEALAPVEP